MRTPALVLLLLLLSTAVTGAKPAPDFTVRSLDGRTVHLRDLRGKVVVVNFWATWCGGCKVEIPHLVEIYRRLHSRGLEIIGFSMDDAGDDVVTRFAKLKQMDYTIARPTDDVTKSYGGLLFLPQTFVVDQHGMIVATISGPPEPHAFEEMLEALLRGQVMEVCISQPRERSGAHSAPDLWPRQLRAPTCTSPRGAAARC
jgi:peroxiredoxin